MGESGYSMRWRYYINIASAFTTLFNGHRDLDHVTCEHVVPQVPQYHQAIETYRTSLQRAKILSSPLVFAISAPFVFASFSAVSRKSKTVRSRRLPGS